MGDSSEALDDTDPENDEILQSYIPEIVSREEWGAKESRKKAKLKTPAKKIVFSTTMSRRCFSKPMCKYNLKIYQQEEFEKSKNDIPFNFLIASDGRIYEGMGWDHQADCSYSWWWPSERHLKELYETSIHVGFVQHRNFLLSQRQIKLALGLLIAGIQAGKLDENIDIIEDDVIGPVFPQGDLMAMKGEQEGLTKAEIEEKRGLITMLEDLNRYRDNRNKMTMEEMMKELEDKDGIMKRFKEFDEKLKIKNQKKIEKEYPWAFESKSKNKT